MNIKFTHVRILLAVSALLFLAYLPGLNGPYVLDDGENIYLNDAIALKQLNPTDLHNALRANESGPFLRPLASLSFALNHYFAGGFDKTLPFKITNLIIHLINAVLVYFLAQRLLQSPVLRGAFPGANPLPVAALTCALWALHPVQLTNVLYVVQRMNSLSALGVLTGLLVFMKGRRLIDESRPGGITVMSAGIILGLLLGLVSKENAALLPLFALAIEYAFYRRDRLEVSLRRRLYAFYLLMVLIPLGLFALYLISHPEFITGAYALRHFTLYERLLTEARVLWFYLGLFIFPTPGRLGLFHDDIALSTGLLAPPATLLAVAGLCALTLLALIKNKTWPVASFAVLWFLAGHLLESSMFGLEIAYEHRNYLPSLGFFFLLSFMIMRLLRQSRLRETVGVLFPIGLVLVLAFTTWSCASAWSSLAALAQASARQHPHSPRANDFASKVHLLEANDINRAIDYALKTVANAPQEPGSRIYLRLLLATAETEINESLRGRQKQGRHAPKNIAIKGLPPEVTVKMDGHNARLSHEAAATPVITSLLQTQPVTVHTVVALESLRRCALDTPSVCAPLIPDALNWLAIAANNPRSSDDYRAIMFRDAAMLNASRGDYRQALQDMEKAAQLDAGVLAYRLAKAEYLIRTGNLDQAGTLLDALTEEVVHFPRYFDANRKALDTLAEMHARAAKKAAPPAPAAVAQ